MQKDFGMWRSNIMRTVSLKYLLASQSMIALSQSSPPEKSKENNSMLLSSRGRHLGLLYCDYRINLIIHWLFNHS